MFEQICKKKKHKTEIAAKKELHWNFLQFSTTCFLGVFQIKWMCELNLLFVVVVWLYNVWCAHGIYRQKIVDKKSRGDKLNPNCGLKLALHCGAIEGRNSLSLYLKLL